MAEQTTTTLPGIENESANQNAVTLPGFENDELPSFEETPMQKENNILPGMEEQQSYTPNDVNVNNAYTPSNTMFNANSQIPQNNIQNLTNYNQEPSGQLQNLL